MYIYNNNNYRATFIYLVFILLKKYSFPPFFSCRINSKKNK